MNQITRTSAGLRDALFDAIEKVNSGQMEANDAKAIANLSLGIVKTVQLEIEIHKLRAEFPADMKMVLPGKVFLGEEREKNAVSTKR